MHYKRMPALITSVVRDEKSHCHYNNNIRTFAHPHNNNESNPILWFAYCCTCHIR